MTIDGNNDGSFPYRSVTENTDRSRKAHGVQQEETAHVQQFAVASTTETTVTLVVRADVE